ncbi:MAG: hypothetical protein CSA07_01700 [Bacteroidia bacterium]|nr:MAG: hypothetical protein CSA07_01700 [Bacteroidia bacterium]
MTPFLKQVAKDLLGQWGAKGLGDAVLFFPSARTRLAFVQELHGLHEGPLLLPEWGDLRGVMERLTGLEVVEPLALVGEVHRWMMERGVLRGTPEEDIESFFPWALTILSDFDQVDKYRVDARRLFLNIRDLKSMDSPVDYLSPEQVNVLRAYFGELFRGESAITGRYQSIWNVLYELYEYLRRCMAEHGQSYEGAVIRHGVDRLLAGEDLRGKGLLPERVAFVGFNALNACEQAFFERVGKPSGDTRYYWNYADYLLDEAPDEHDGDAVVAELEEAFGRRTLDEQRGENPAAVYSLNLLEQFRRAEGAKRYFLRRPREEAGLFISQNLRAFPNALGPSSAESMHATQRICLHATPTILSQAEVLGSLLQELEKDTTDWSRTVVVLPDESLLFPVLDQMPHHLAQTANITMGYPMRSTPVYDLLHDATQYLQLQGAEDEIPTELHDRLWLNPIIKGWVGAQRRAEMATRTTESGPAPGPSRHVQGLLEGLAADHADTDALRAELKLLERIAEGWTADTPLVWQAYVHNAYGLLSDLRTTLRRIGLRITPRLLLRLLPQVFATAKLPIKGETTRGIQVMGFLETRNLDFDRVIILSTNELYLPAQQRRPSFIFGSLQRLYGLPSLADREAMYAYYFHMAIARAERVHLIHVKNETLGQEGEESRYILQIKHLWGMGERLRSVSYLFNPSPSQLAAASVPKEGPIRARLEAILQGEGHFSPSAIKELIGCPLRFYYSRLAGLHGRGDNGTGEFDPLLFGNIVHRSLNELYAPLVDPEGKRELKAHQLEALLRHGTIRAKVREKTIELLAEEKARHEQDNPRGMLPEGETGAKARGIRLNTLQELQLEGVEKVVGNVIRTDMHSLRPESQTRLLAILELEGQHGLTLDVEGVGRVGIRGYIDRIDLVEHNGKRLVRVLDYKTGRRKSANMCFTQIGELFEGSHLQSGQTVSQENILQVMLYCEMLQQERVLGGLAVEAEGLLPALYYTMPGSNSMDALEDKEQGILKAAGVSQKTEEGTREIESYAPYRRELLDGLKDLLRRLFDWQEDFAPLAEEHSHRCAFCDYRELCHRSGKSR